MPIAESILKNHLNFGNFIYEYDLANILRFLSEIDVPTNKESQKRRRNIKHYLIHPKFNIDRVLNALFILYTKKPTGNLNNCYFEDYREQVKIKHEK